jgi:hypothetical protein
MASGRHTHQGVTGSFHQHPDLPSRSLVVKCLVKELFCLLPVKWLPAQVLHHARAVKTLENSGSKSSGSALRSISRLVAIRVVGILSEA